MKVISLNGRSKPCLKKTCAAIGIFDGVHRGHRYLIKQMLATARRLGAQPIVITFFPHPAHVFQPKKNKYSLEYLTSLQDRFRLLSDLGIAACLVVRFNRSFAEIQPQKFIKDILVKELGVKAVFVGNDFRFGKDRSGDIALFQKLAPQYGYEMHAVSALKQGGAVISSTRIRQLVETGQLNEAARLLGRAVAISGTVVKGSERGKSLGFPTANVDYLKGTVPWSSRGQSPSTTILPPRGVYVVKVLLGKKEYPAIANIGTRPSFEKQISKLYLEVHILDFSRNIYGKHLEVEFLKKIRNEKKFPGPQALIRQIQKDEALARQYFA
jgi:riboflavin kinase / FMN adenylyltransferase